MAISLNAETQKLIEERMKSAGIGSADELVRVALALLDELEPDDQTWAAIDRAETEYTQGKGISVDSAFEQIRQKHFGA